MSLLLGPDTAFTKMGSALANSAGCASKIFFLALGPQAAPSAQGGILLTRSAAKNLPNIKTLDVLKMSPCLQKKGHCNNSSNSNTSNNS